MYFATGPKLDSLSISGKVINSLTGQAEIEAVVLILPLDRDTFSVKKNLPFLPLQIVVVIIS